MLFVYKYYSLKDIEVEFQASLENLLIHEVPGLSWLIKQEELIRHSQSSPPISLYFLFFCEKHNIPVGFCQFNLHDISLTPYLSLTQRMLYRLNRNRTQWKILTCKIHGTNGPGYVFHPHFQSEGPMEMKKIIGELHQQYPVALEVLNYEERPATPSSFSPQFSFGQSIPQVLFKTYKDYSSYINSLGEKASQKVRSLWHKLHEHEDLEVQKFSSLAQVYGQFPHFLEHHWSVNAERYPLYQHLQGIYWVFHSRNSQQSQVLGMVVLLESQSGHLFCDLFHRTDQQADQDQKGNPAGIGPEMLGQFAIKVFFEMESSRRLHFLNPPLDREGKFSYLEGLGLAVKKRHVCINPIHSVVEKNWEQIKQQFPFLQSWNQIH